MDEKDQTFESRYNIWSVSRILIIFPLHCTGVLVRITQRQKVDKTLMGRESALQTQRETMNHFMHIDAAATEQ
jgi:hypothetical protein